MNEYTVYKHTFPNEKVYIGITMMDPTKRWANGHGYSGQKKMNDAIVKFGWENIKHEILYTGLSRKEACKKETELIESLNAIENGYNTSKGGTNTRGGCEGPYKYKDGDVYAGYEVVGRDKTRIILKCLNCGKTIKRYAGSIKNFSVRCECKTKRGTLIFYNGKEMSAKDWSVELGISAETILYRYFSGKPIDKPGKDPSWRKFKPCEKCGQIFFPKEKRQKYCSNKCCTDALKKERPKLICQCCGREFQTTRCLDKNYRGMFCSIDCRIRFQQGKHEN